MWGEDPKQGQVSKEITEALGKLTVELEKLGATVTVPEGAWRKEEQRIIEYKDDSLSIHIRGQRTTGYSGRLTGTLRIEYGGANRRQNRPQPKGGWNYEKLAQELLGEIDLYRKKVQGWEATRKKEDAAREQAKKVKEAIENGPLSRFCVADCVPNNGYSLDLRLQFLTKEQALTIVAILNNSAELNAPCGAVKEEV